jgi:hypothetical protein
MKGKEATKEVRIGMCAPAAASLSNNYSLLPNPPPPKCLRIRKQIRVGQDFTVFP